MSGFFGFGRITGGTVVGSVLGGSGLFGPNFIPTVVAGNSIVGLFSMFNNSSGPFLPNSVYSLGMGHNTPSGVNIGFIAPDPLIVNAQNLTIFGHMSAGPNNYIVVGINAPGLLQSHFTSLDFTDSIPTVYHLTTASAVFNGPPPFADAAYSVWTWQPVPFPHLNQMQSVTFNW